MRREELPGAFHTCGVRIDAVTLDQTVDAILDADGGSWPRRVHTCNAYTLALARRDATFAGVLAGDGLNVPDGMPLVWVARRLGFRHCRDRVYGPDLMLETMRRGVGQDTRHYLYGSTEQVLARLEPALRARVPGVRIVGRESPPFRALTSTEREDVIDRLATARPDVVWVGLGTPKQDQFLARHARRVSAALVGVGAAFDFHAGVKPQAPGWLQRMGLEWAFRLATEPRRLWRRYLIGNVGFLLGLLEGVAVIDPGEDERG